MATSSSGGKVTTGLNGRLVIDRARGRLLITGVDGKNKLLAGIDDEGEVKVKLAQDGFNVLTATDDELILSSDFNSFKIVETDVATVDDFSAESVDGGITVGETSVSYSVDISQPLVIANIISDTEQYKFRPSSTPVSDSTIGSHAWDIGSTNPPQGNVELDPLEGIDIKDYDIRLVLPGDVLGSTNKADGYQVPETAVFHTYGDSDDTWGEVLSGADINDPEFGFAISYQEETNSEISEYFKVADLGFNVPDNVDVIGIQVEVSPRYSIQPGIASFVYIEDMIVTVYTVNNNSMSDWEATVLGYENPSGSGTIGINSILNRKMSAADGIITFRAESVLAASNLGTYKYGPWQVRYYVLAETAGA